MSHPVVEKGESLRIEEVLPRQGDGLACGLPGRRLGGSFSDGLGRHVVVSRDGNQDSIDQAVPVRCQAQEQW